MSENPIRQSHELFRIRVELRDAYPKIWRRLDVPSNLSLLDLNDVIQAAFSWEHSHLWLFDAGNTTYVDLDLVDWWTDSYVDADQISLDGLVEKEIRKFTYKYDFGDNWVHFVSIFKRRPKWNANLSYPALVGGERRSPLEDIGGVWGHEVFTNAINDPEHPNHDWYLEWTGGESFDPDQMEEQEIRERLASVARRLA